MKRFRVWALALILLLIPIPPASAATLGPALSYDELRTLASQANDGDVLLVAGDFSAGDDDVLSISASVRISSAPGESATIRGLHLRDASVTFSNVNLEDSLVVEGTSFVEVAAGVAISGAPGQSGLAFSGNGTLIVDRNSDVLGGSSSTGVSISHQGGEFYGSIEGSVRGGDGSTGGAGMIISPLGDAGTVMISGTIRGGDGTSMGGHALNLYGLSGNAFVTVAGTLTGGDGYVGGDGIQLVSATDVVSVGISGDVKGGQGESYGGSALMLMNVEGASSFNLSGSFTGGDAVGADAQPGTSLLLVGDSAASHTRVNNCILEDGHHLNGDAQATEAPEQLIQPTVTPLPEITSSIDDVAVLPTPQPTETPEPSDTPEPANTESPSAAPDWDDADIATPSEASRADAYQNQPEETAEAETDK